MTCLSTSVRYAFAKAASTLGGFHGQFAGGPARGLPGWATWNVEGAVQVTDRLEVRLSGLNLLDLHYRLLGRAFRARPKCVPRSPHDSEYLRGMLYAEVVGRGRRAPNCESPLLSRKYSPTV